MPRLTFGVIVPYSGPAALAHNLAQAARAAERPGFDTLWTAAHDHVGRRIPARYPHNASGPLASNPDPPSFGNLRARAGRATCDPSTIRVSWKLGAQRVGEEIAAHLRRVRSLVTDTVLLELRGTTPEQLQGASTWLAREVRPRVE